MTITPVELSTLNPIFGKDSGLEDHSIVIIIKWEKPSSFIPGPSKHVLRKGPRHASGYPVRLY